MPWDDPVPKQDVLPWLQQAVIDWETECYRPSAHYLMLFRGAAQEIVRLRKELLEPRSGCGVTAP